MGDVGVGVDEPMKLANVRIVLADFAVNVNVAAVGDRAAYDPILYDFRLLPAEMSMRDVAVSALARLM